MSYRYLKITEIGPGSGIAVFCNGTVLLSDVWACPNSRMTPRSSVLVTFYSSAFPALVGCSNGMKSSRVEMKTKHLCSVSLILTRGFPAAGTARDQHGADLTSAPVALAADTQIRTPDSSCALVTTGTLCTHRTHWFLFWFFCWVKLGTRNM